ncbi:MULTISPECIES: WD40 repeat domain-containing protein [unclassified Nocardiopsis]|uniref:WD40 repeat domain-containing protein n=1 Tax=unclassified Nocardiopsis TaxID=2649073 RepID=UPI001F33499C|nr:MULTISPECIES: WD40 repeat domain-containing protein [unclassified Nocardiopsis]
MHPLNPDEPTRLGDFRLLPHPGSGGTEHVPPDAHRSSPRAAAPPPGRAPRSLRGRRVLLRACALTAAAAFLAGAGLYSLAAPAWDPSATVGTDTGGCSASASAVSDRLAPPGDPQVTFSDDLPLELSFSPDGSVLAVSQIDAVTLWDWRESRAIAQIDHGASAVPPTPASFSPDGCLVAYGTPHGAAVVDLSTGRGRTVGADQAVRALAFSPDGSSLALGVGSDPAGRLLHLHETSTWKLESRLAGSAPLGSVRYSFDGSVVAGGENDGGVAVWNVDRPRSAGLVRDRAGVGADAFDVVPDGTAVLVIRSGSVLLVDPRTEEVLREYVPGTDEGVLVDVAYSAASGRVFAARLDPATDTGDMVAWEYGAATEVALGTDLPRVFPMALSEDGSRVAGLRTRTGDIAVYDTDLSLLNVLTR